MVLPSDVPPFLPIILLFLCVLWGDRWRDGHLPLSVEEGCRTSEGAGEGTHVMITQQQAGVWRSRESQTNYMAFVVYFIWCAGRYHFGSRVEIPNVAALTELRKLAYRVFEI